VPYEDRSQISAGWKWQVQPNWSVHAEASYGLNGANLDPNSPDRSRIFFGTRFDFR
jgi:long-subunit fatty acid transport protein